MQSVTNYFCWFNNIPMSNVNTNERSNAKKNICTEKITRYPVARWLFWYIFGITGVSYFESSRSWNYYYYLKKKIKIIYNDRQTSWLCIAQPMVVPLVYMQSNAILEVNLELSSVPSLNFLVIAAPSLFIIAEVYRLDVSLCDMFRISVNFNRIQSISS